MNLIACNSNFICSSPSAPSFQRGALIISAVLQTTNCSVQSFSRRRVIYSCRAEKNFICVLSCFLKLLVQTLKGFLCISWILLIRVLMVEVLSLSLTVFSGFLQPKLCVVLLTKVLSRAPLLKVTDSSRDLSLTINTMVKMT